MRETKTWANAYRDSFSVQHADLAHALSYVEDMESYDRWITVPSNRIRFIPIPMDAGEIEDFAVRMGITEDIDILTDTASKSGAGLMALIDGEKYFIRDCGMKTILERAKISGAALGRLTRENLADVLNRCMEVSRGDALVYFSNEKISAIHGGDKSDYSVLLISKLYNAFDEELATRFPDNEFQGGYTDHSISTAMWTLPEQKDDLLDSYEKEVERCGLRGRILVPGLRFTTSNVGQSGANVYPYVMDAVSGRILRVGTAISVKHKNETTVADFAGEIKLLYPKFIDATKALTKLMDIDIYYPLNAMEGVMKKVGIHKKIAFEVLEKFKTMNGEGPTNAHECFWGISEATFFMRADKMSETKILAAEDCIARILHMNWGEFDIGEKIAC